MAELCKDCLHRPVCARQCQQMAEAGCAHYMGWVSTENEMPPMADFPFWSRMYGQKRSERVVTTDGTGFIIVQVNADGGFSHRSTHWLKGLVLPRKKNG